MNEYEGMRQFCYACISHSNYVVRARKGLIGLHTYAAKHAVNAKL